MYTSIHKVEKNKKRKIEIQRIVGRIGCLQPPPTPLHTFYFSFSFKGSSNNIQNLDFTVINLIDKRSLGQPSLIDCIKRCVMGISWNANHDEVVGLMEITEMEIILFAFSLLLLYFILIVCVFTPFK